ncbi:MAG TPA: sulfotransferase [Acidimicrobiia bacterium]
MIIGAQRAGTTSLYSWLTSHRDVLPAREKELHFFDQDPASRPIDRYREQFPLQATRRVLQTTRRRPVVTGEATPYYLFHPLVPARVHRHLPDVKLIVLLRDPVERAVSNYWFEYNYGTETLTLERALAAEEERIRPDLDRTARGEEPTGALQSFSYVARGLYAEQLRRWTELFDRSQLLVLQFEQLASTPAAALDDALRFLGVDPGASPRPRFEPMHTGHRQPTPPETLGWLRQRFEEPNRELFAQVGIDYNAVDAFAPAR